MARSAHSMHDLKMVGKLQRGSALVHQTPCASRPMERSYKGCKIALFYTILHEIRVHSIGTSQSHVGTP